MTTEPTIGEETIDLLTNLASDGSGPRDVAYWEERSEADQNSPDGNEGYISWCGLQAARILHRLHTQALENYLVETEREFLEGSNPGQEPSGILNWSGGFESGDPQNLSP